MREGEAGGGGGQLEEARGWRIEGRGGGLPGDGEKEEEEEGEEEEEEPPHLRLVIHSSLFHSASYQVRKPTWMMGAIKQEATAAAAGNAAVKPRRP